MPTEQQQQIATRSIDGLVRHEHWPQVSQYVGWVYRAKDRMPENNVRPMPPNIRHLALKMRGTCVKCENKIRYFRERGGSALGVSLACEQGDSSGCGKGMDWAYNQLREHLNKFDDRQPRNDDGADTEPEAGMREDANQLIEQAVTQMLTALDSNSDREGLRETPQRVAKSLLSLCVPEPFEFTTFDAEGMDEMITESPIPFYSLCEHHMLPFFGVATVAYIPKKKIVGLSKLPRAVRHCAAGLQNQERITQAIAKMLCDSLQCPDIAVVLQGRHLCMEMRGVRAPGVITTTSCLWGAFRTDAATRAEFLRQLPPKS